MSDKFYNKNPKISVIIPVKDDNLRLKKCLESLRVQTYPKDLFEVIVVDNGSEQNVGSVVSCFSGVTCISEPVPGPAAARNRGISFSAGDILAFTDSDCRPEPSWIENGVKALLALDAPGMAAGRIDFTYVSDYPLLPELYDTITYFSQRRYIEQYHFGATANLFVVKKILEDVGCFDNISFKGAAGEDADWGKRFFDAGYPQIYVDDAVVKHPAVSTCRGLWRKTERITRGNIALSRKYGRHQDKEKEGYIKFLYRVIWKNKTVTGMRSKVVLTVIAFSVIIVKIKVRIFG